MIFRLILEIDGTPYAAELVREGLGPGERAYTLTKPDGVVRTVRQEYDRQTCTCPDFEHRGRARLDRCKHLRAAVWAGLLDASPRPRPRPAPAGTRVRSELDEDAEGGAG